MSGSKIFFTGCLSAIVILAGVFIWPTRYDYHHEKNAYGVDMALRIDRLSGQTQRKSPSGWQTITQNKQENIKHLETNLSEDPIGEGVRLVLPPSEDTGRSSHTVLSTVTGHSQLSPPPENATTLNSSSPAPQTQPGDSTTASENPSGDEATSMDAPLPAADPQHFNAPVVPAAMGIEHMDVQRPAQQASDANPGQ